MTSATPEQKEHMLNLVKEMEGYSNIIQNKIEPLSPKELISMAKRMAVIVKEMKDFRRDYPND